MTAPEILTTAEWRLMHIVREFSPRDRTGDDVSLKRLRDSLLRMPERATRWDAHRGRGVPVIESERLDVEASSDEEQQRWLVALAAAGWSARPHAYSLHIRVLVPESATSLGGTHRVIVDRGGESADLELERDTQGWYWPGTDGVSDIWAVLPPVWWELKAVILDAID